MLQRIQDGLDHNRKSVRVDLTWTKPGCVDRHTRKEIGNSFFGRRVLGAIFALRNMKKGWRKDEGELPLGGEGENGMQYPDGGVEIELWLEEGANPGKKGYTDVESGRGRGRLSLPKSGPRPRRARRRRLGRLEPAGAKAKPGSFRVCWGKSRGGGARWGRCQRSRCWRMSRITLGCSITAMRFKVEPHLGHSKGSISYTLRSNLAQLTPRRRGGFR